MISQRFSGAYTYTHDGLSTTNWNHFAYRGRGGGSGRYDAFFINGELVNSNSTASAWNAGASPYNQVIMAARNFTLPLNGAADDVKIWATGLTDAEINTLYTNGLAAHP